MVLSRHHAEKLLNLLSTSKCDLVKCWRNSFNPDLVTDNFRNFYLRSRTNNHLYVLTADFFPDYAIHLGLYT